MHTFTRHSTAQSSMQIHNDTAKYEKTEGKAGIVKVHINALYVTVEQKTAASQGRGEMKAANKVDMS